MGRGFDISYSAAAMARHEELVGEMMSSNAAAAAAHRAISKPLTVQQLEAALLKKDPKNRRDGNVAFVAQQRQCPLHLDPSDGPFAVERHRRLFKGRSIGEERGFGATVLTHIEQQQPAL